MEEELAQEIRCWVFSLSLLTPVFESGWRGVSELFVVKLRSVSVLLVLLT